MLCICLNPMAVLSLLQSGERQLREAELSSAVPKKAPRALRAGGLPGPLWPTSTRLGAMPPALWGRGKAIPRHRGGWGAELTPNATPQKCLWQSRGKEMGINYLFVCLCICTQTTSCTAVLIQAVGSPVSAVGFGCRLCSETAEAMSKKHAEIKVSSQYLI